MVMTIRQYVHNLLELKVTFWNYEFQYLFVFSPSLRHPPATNRTNHCQVTSERLCEQKARNGTPEDFLWVAPKWFWAKMLLTGQAWLCLVGSLEVLKYIYKKSLLVWSAPTHSFTIFGSLTGLKWNSNPSDQSHQIHQCSNSGNAGHRKPEGDDFHDST